MGGIGIITNPRASHNKRYPEESKRLAYVLGDVGTCKETGTPEEVEEVAREFKRRQIHILGLNGGDGTNHVTLSAFIRVYGDMPLPKIAFLRGGTMNSIAIACGVKGGPERILRNLVEKYHKGIPFQTVRRSTIKVGDDQYGFLVGTGVIFSFIEEYHANGNPGPVRAATLLTQTLGSAIVGGGLAKRLCAPLVLQVEEDGKRWRHERFLALAAATLHYVGLGFSPFHRCYERLGAFHLLGIHCNPTKLIAEFPRVMGKRGFTSKVAQSAVSSNAIIRADNGIQYIIDGDVYQTKGNLVLGAGPIVEVIVH